MNQNGSGSSLMEEVAFSPQPPREPLFPGFENIGPTHRVGRNERDDKRTLLSIAACRKQGQNKERYANPMKAPRDTG